MIGRPTVYGSPPEDIRLSHGNAVNSKLGKSLIFVVNGHPSRRSHNRLKWTKSFGARLGLVADVVEEAILLVNEAPDVGTCTFEPYRE